MIGNCMWSAAWHVYLAGESGILVGQRSPVNGAYVLEGT